MPAHNEQDAVSRTILECRDTVLHRFAHGEIICVDDASSDATPEVLASLQAQVDGLRVYRNAANLGHGPSLRKALSLADADFVLCIDSDYQLRPRDFWLLYERLAPGGIVIGARTPRRDGAFRRLAGALANRLVCTVFSVPVTDFNSPFKLFTGRALGELLPLLPENPVIPSILLAVAAYRRGIPVRGASVPHFARASGENWLTVARFSGFALAALRELMRFRRSLPPGPR